jgi:DNA repair exonuclease SbcCD ATPase subunit
MHVSSNPGQGIFFFHFFLYFCIPLTFFLIQIKGDINKLKDGKVKTDSDIDLLNKLFKTLENRMKDLESFKKNVPTLDQMKRLEDDLNALRKSVERMTEFDSKLGEMNKRINDIDAKLLQMVTFANLDLYVKWEQLESALKGMREQLDNNNKKITEITPPKSQPVQIQTFTQTTPVPTPVQPPSRPASTSKFPTEELQEILIKLGTLNDRHETLREQVERLKKDLDAKPNEVGVKLPDDFAKKMEEIQRIKEALNDLKFDFSFIFYLFIHFFKFF